MSLMSTSFRLQNISENTSCFVDSLFLGATFGHGVEDIHHSLIAPESSVTFLGYHILRFIKRIFFVWLDLSL